MVTVFDPHRPIIDIGANIGHVTCFISDRCHSTVTAYEPSVENFRSLKINTARLNNIVIKNLAVGKTNGEITFSDAGTVTSRVATNGTKKHLSKVRIVTLDNDHEGDVGTLKIDVEGFEMNVLIGAKMLIQKHSPIVIIEVIDNYLKRFGSSRQEVLNFFRTMGYRSPVDKYGRNTTAAEDLIFAPKGVWLPRLYISLLKSFEKYPSSKEF